MDAWEDPTFRKIRDALVAEFGKENLSFEYLDYAEKMGACLRYPKLHRRHAVMFESYVSEAVIEPVIRHFRAWQTDPWSFGVGIGDTIRGNEHSAFRIACDENRQKD